MNFENNFELIDARVYNNTDQIKIIEWCVTFTNEDGKESIHHVVSELPDSDSGPYVPLNQMSTDDILQLGIQHEGGQAFIDQLKAIAVEEFENQNIVEHTTPVLSPTPTETPTHNVKRSGDLIVWAKTFEDGEERIDRFPTPDMDFYALVNPGDWVTKPYVSFVSAGRFELEADDGSTYYMDVNTPPRLYNPAVAFKFTALDEGEFVCIRHRNRDRLIQYDTFRHVDREVNIDSGIKGFAYVVSGSVSTGSETLSAGDIYHFDDGVTLTSDGPLNVITAINPRDYEFEKTSVTPNYAKKAQL